MGIFERGAVFAAIFARLVLAESATDRLEVISWNVESGGARLSGVLPRISSFDACDVWGFAEVRNKDWVEAIEKACEEGKTQSYTAILGSTGGADRLAIVFNDERVRLIRSLELHEINPRGRVRAPLVAEFQIKATGETFFFMVNHLYRRDATARHLQAKAINQWARKLDAPIIATGDYNFDWSVEDGDQNRDLGYDYLVADDQFKWVRPKPMIKTQSSKFDSVLDFVFLGGVATEWFAESQIVVEEGDFPDSHLTSDHRPVRAWVQVGSASVNDGSKGSD